MAGRGCALLSSFFNVSLLICCSDISFYTLSLFYSSAYIPVSHVSVICQFIKRRCSPFHSVSVTCRKIYRWRKLLGPAGPTFCFLWAGPISGPPTFRRSWDESQASLNTQKIQTVNINVQKVCRSAPKHTIGTPLYAHYTLATFHH